MSLDDHLRYLERRLAGCVPASIHRAQIAAYREAIDAARAAASDAEYLAATSNLLELARSEWIDRYQAAARFYDSIGDDVRAAIARASAAAAGGPDDHAELLRALIGSKLATQREREGAEDAAAQIPVLVLALIGLRLESNPAARVELRSELGVIWNQIAAGDRTLSPARLLDHRPYRHRLPFADDGVRALIAWLDEEALEIPPAPGPAAPIDLPEVEIPVATAPPTAGEVAAPYRAAAAALDPDHPSREIYQRIDELAAEVHSGDALLAAMAEEDLFVSIARAPLIAAARAALDAIEPAQRAPRAHHERLIAALEAARSIPEIELIELAADEHIAVESAWSHLLFAIALMPVAAALAYDVDRSGWRLDRLERTEAIAVDLFGAGTAALLEVGAIWETFVREVFERGQTIRLEAPAHREIHRGETAVSIAGQVQAAAIQWAIAEASRSPDPEAALGATLGARRFATPEAMRDHVLALLGEVGIVPGGRVRPLTMWGSPVAPEDLAAALADPPRPALPL